MINNNTQNQVSFGTKIYFVSPQKFGKIFNKHITQANNNFVNAPWNISTIRSSDSWLGTSDINTCTAGVLSNGKAMMQHFMTSDENFQNINNIEKIFRDFTKGKEIISSILLGSRPKNFPAVDLTPINVKNPENIFDVKSEKLMQIMKNFVKRFDPTIFEGHKLPNARSHMVYDVKGDNCYICTTKKLLDMNSYVKNYDDLNEVFSNVYISKRDSVEFVKDSFASEMLNKGINEIYEAMMSFGKSIKET